MAVVQVDLLRGYPDPLPISKNEPKTVRRLKKEENGGERTPSLLEVGVGPVLFPRRPVLVNALVLVRERRLSETTLFALFVEFIESERATVD